jgi:hypothetical protein
MRPGQNYKHSLARDWHKFWPGIHGSLWRQLDFIQTSSGFMMPSSYQGVLVNWNHTLIYPRIALNWTGHDSQAYRRNGRLCSNVNIQISKVPFGFLKMLSKKPVAHRALPKINNKNNKITQSIRMGPTNQNWQIFVSFYKAEKTQAQT